MDVEAVGVDRNGGHRDREPAADHHSRDRHDLPQFTRSASWPLRNRLPLALISVHTVPSVRAA
ncbi:MAG: hypothetical protein M3Q03_09515 [Chloroflexota bacterium]|nr:hypothetical protein [Chloroflexota bacterium]